MRPLALLLASLLPLLAVAQTTTQPLVIRAADGSDTLAIAPSECGGTVTARWTYQVSVGALCTPLKLWVTSGECGEASGTSDLLLDSVPAATVTTTGSDTVSINTRNLPGFKNAADGGSLCGGDGVTITHKVCGAIEYSTYTCGYSTQPKLTASPLTLVYDTQPPTAPVITGVVAQDGAATISFTIDADTVTVVGEYKGPSDADFLGGGEVGSSATKLRVNGLVNGNTYSLRLRAVDSADNVSAPSEEVAATPIRTIGFWGVYREKGGSDPGGCSAVAGAPLALVVLAAWARLRRRRKS